MYGYPFFPYGYGGYSGQGYPYDRYAYPMDLMHHHAAGIAQSILMDAKSEAEAIDFYERIIQNAPATHRRELEGILADERLHLRLFTGVYQRLTGRQPVYQIEQVSFSTLDEAFKKAYEDEFKAYETYRDQYLTVQDQSIKDVLFRAMSDEIEHAIRFGFIRTWG